jgi:dihydroorotase
MEEFNRKNLGLYVLLEDIGILKAYLRKQKQASAVQATEETHELERCRDHLKYNHTALSRYAEPILAKYEELKINLDAVVRSSLRFFL